MAAPPLDAAAARAARATLGEDDLVELLRWMRLQRELEEQIIRLYKQGRIVGGVYTGLGHEAIGAGSASALREDDVIFPSHRDLGAYLVKGMTPFTVLAQYLGRVDGPTRGRDGNLHMGQWDLGIGGFISHMADTVPVAAGVALSFRYRSRSSVVLCYNGDGATSRGDWHEGINLAAVEKLPVIYICVNNGFAYSTPTARQMAVDRVATRAGGYGIPGRLVDGNDVLAVYVAAREAIDRARAGDGPTLLECRTYRMTGHSAHDPADYVPTEFWDEGRRMDPIDRYQAWLVAEGLIGEPGIERLEDDVVREVEEAAERALASPEPSADDVLEGVYARPSGPPGAGAGGAPHTPIEPKSVAQ